MILKNDREFYQALLDGKTVIQYGSAGIDHQVRLNKNGDQEWRNPLSHTWRTLTPKPRKVQEEPKKEALKIGDIREWNMTEKASPRFQQFKIERIKGDIVYYKYLDKEGDYVSCNEFVNEIDYTLKKSTHVSSQEDRDREKALKSFKTFACSFHLPLPELYPWQKRALSKFATEEAFQIHDEVYLSRTTDWPLLMQKVEQAQSRTDRTPQDETKEAKMAALQAQPDFEFKEGDKVKCAFYGDEVFTLGKYPDSIYPLSFETPKRVHSFTRKGLHNEIHTHSILTLVDRKIEKVAKYKVAYKRNAYHGWEVSTGYYTSAQEFKDHYLYDILNAELVLGSRKEFDV